MSNWFQDNLSNTNDNPSNSLSSGYISVYDSNNSRIIFTKKNQVKSWTISYSLETGTWISFHSYKPNFYYYTPTKFYSFINESNSIWVHNIDGLYQTYYNKLEPHVIEYISNPVPIISKIWDQITLQTECRIYDEANLFYKEDILTTFNKAIIYTDRQTSGLLTLIPKDKELLNEDYLLEQVRDDHQNISIIDRTEKYWFINDFRDIRIDYNKPVWVESASDYQKELNVLTLDLNKDWTQLESFRDTYLGIQLIFDNFANRKLITHFTSEEEQKSQF